MQDFWSCVITQKEWGKASHCSGSGSSTAASNEKEIRKERKRALQFTQQVSQPPFPNWDLQICLRGGRLIFKMFFKLLLLLLN